MICQLQRRRRNMTVGQRIRVSRRACGLSLRDLEARIDNRVTAQAISKYERDESMPSSGVLIALVSDALGVPVDLPGHRQRHSPRDRRIPKEAAHQPGARRHRSKPMSCTCSNATSRWRKSSACPPSPGICREKPRGPWLQDPAEAEHAALGLPRPLGSRIRSDPQPSSNLLEERGIKVLAMSLLNIDGLTGTGTPRRQERRNSVVVVNRDDWGRTPALHARALELGHMALEIAPKIRPRESRPPLCRGVPHAGRGRSATRSANAASPWAGASSSTSSASSA